MILCITALRTKTTVGVHNDAPTCSRMSAADPQSLSDSRGPSGVMLSGCCTAAGPLLILVDGLGQSYTMSPDLQTNTILNSPL